MSFADLGLEPKLLDAIKASGYENPTPIQKEAIPPSLEGKDVLGIAQTGTGKTASFTLPMIQRLAKGRARGAHAAIAGAGADTRTRGAGC